jgi:hypothetical protein
VLYAKFRVETGEKPRWANTLWKRYATFIALPVSDFIHAVFEQLAAGKTEITFGFSEAMNKASQDDIRQAFARMNPSTV